MQPEKITLGPEDPTIFAKCPNCDKHGDGVKPDAYYGKAYTERRFKRGPVCENCETPMVKLFEVDRND